MLDMEAKMDYVNKCEDGRGLFVSEQTEFARQYIFPTVSVFAKQKRSKMADGLFGFRKLVRKEVKKNDGTHMEENWQEGYLLVC